MSFEEPSSRKRPRIKPKDESIEIDVRDFDVKAKNTAKPKEMPVEIEIPVDDFEEQSFEINLDDLSSLPKKTRKKEVSLINIEEEEPVFKPRKEKAITPNENKIRERLEQSEKLAQIDSSLKAIQNLQNSKSEYQEELKRVFLLKDANASLVEQKAEEYREKLRKNKGITGVFRKLFVSKETRQTEIQESLLSWKAAKEETEDLNSAIKFLKEEIKSIDKKLSEKYAIDPEFLLKEKSKIEEKLGINFQEIFTEQWLNSIAEKYDNGFFEKAKAELKAKNEISVETMKEFKAMLIRVFVNNFDLSVFKKVAKTFSNKGAMVEAPNAERLISMYGEQAAENLVDYFLKAKETNEKQEPNWRLQQEIESLANGFSKDRLKIELLPANKNDFYKKFVKKTGLHMIDTVMPDAKMPNDYTIAYSYLQLERLQKMDKEKPEDRQELQNFDLQKTLRMGKGAFEEVYEKATGVNLIDLSYELSLAKERLKEYAKKEQTLSLTDDFYNKIFSEVFNRLRRKSIYQKKENSFKLKQKQYQKNPNDNLLLEMETLTEQLSAMKKNHYNIVKPLGINDIKQILQAS